MVITVSVGAVLLSTLLFVDELDAVLLISVLHVLECQWSLLAPLEGRGCGRSLVEAYVNLDWFRFLDHTNRSDRTELAKHFLSTQDVVVHDIILQHNRQNAEIIEDLHGSQFTERKSRMMDQLALHCVLRTKSNIDRRWMGTASARWRLEKVKSRQLVVW